MSRVFISHTSDMATWPPHRSFVRAAVDAVLRAGWQPVEMAYFPAGDSEPAAYCQRRVRECDAYVGLVGFRYGSLVPGRGIAYTELEFRTAAEAGIPRLVFLLDEQAPAPRPFSDSDGGEAEAFRGRLVSSGLVVGWFTSPDSLETAVLHALVELGSNGTRLRGGTGTSGASRPWMAPALPGRLVGRPELLAPLLAGLTAPGAQTVGITTALEGAGGFGKTSLAAQACHHREMSRRFPGGLLWVTVGDDTRGAALAGVVNGLCELLSGQPGTASDPAVAGGRLGDLLDGREPMLLVVDDVWTRHQLAPFLIGGSRCRRLVTTRNRGVVPAGGASLLVDEMTAAQAEAALAADLAGGLPGPVVGRLVALTGRWPLLLGLVNRAIAECVGDGAGPVEAAQWLARRLASDGPAALDVDDPDSRDRAAAATINVSLGLLTPAERDRYHSLAIFPEDADIPVDMLGLVWAAGGELPMSQVLRLRDKLVRLRLALGRWVAGQPALRLHDVFRAYLRHRAGPSELAGGHEAFVAAAAALLSEAGSSDLRRWWALPATADYLWRYVPYHLAGASRIDELAATVCDLRWVEAKISRSGSPVAAEADLTAVGTPTAVNLRRALAQSAHVLGRLDPPTALAPTLVSRLCAVPRLREMVEAHRRRIPEPRLDLAWPLPEPADPALVRVLAVPGAVPGRQRMRKAAFSADGALLATIGDARAVLIWDPSTGRTRSTAPYDYPTGASCVALSPDGTVLAICGCRGEVGIWDVATGHRKTAMQAGHSQQVSAAAFSPDGTMLATASYYDRTVYCWDAATGARYAVLDGHTDMVSGVAFSPDGTMLATASHDHTVGIWDAATGTRRGRLVGHTGCVEAVAFSPDGTLLATSGGDSYRVGDGETEIIDRDDTVRLWDVAALRQRSVLTGHPGMRGCVFSRDGALVATFASGKTSRLWDVASGRLVAELAGHTSPLIGCQFSRDGSELVTASIDQTVRRWDIRTAVKEGRRSGGHDGSVDSAVFSPDGTLLATTSTEDRTTRVWEVSTGEEQFAVDGVESRGVTFLPDGTVLTLGNGEVTRTARGAVEKVALTPTRYTEPPEYGPVIRRCDGSYGCSFSGDGALVAAGAVSLQATKGSPIMRPEKAVLVWEVATGREKAVLSGHTGGVVDCVFSPDATLVVGASCDSTRIWDVASGEVHAVIDQGYRMVFSPDGALLAITGWEFLEIFDLRERGLRPTRIETSRVSSIAFSPDCSRLATAGSDGMLLIWDIATEQCVGGLRVGAPLNGLAWHPKGKLICAVGAAGVYLFSYNP